MFNILANFGATIISSIVVIGSPNASTPPKSTTPDLVFCEQLSTQEVKAKNIEVSNQVGLNTEKPIPTPNDIGMIIEKYSEEYGVESNLMKKIAKCESTFNPNAINGKYAGMYQFVDTTWISTRKQMGLDPNPNLRFDATEAVKTAAFKISKGGKMAWKNCL